MKAKKNMNCNLTNHKDATDRFKIMLKESEARCLYKEEENKQLNNKLTVLKVQVSKIEKL